MKRADAVVRRAFAALTALWFCAALALPWIDSAFQIDPAPPVQEYRMLARIEALAALSKRTDVSIREWTSAYEGWFDDHFGFRDGLLRMSSWIRVRGFHTSPRKDAVLGDDDWLYLGGASQDVCRGLAPFTDEDLERYRFGLQGWRDFCAHHGARLFVGLIPEKQEIRPEPLPMRERCVGAASRTEQLVRALEGSGVELIDLRPPLRAARAGGEVFLKSDSHWNTRGAWVGYRTLLDRVALAFPAASPLDRAATQDTPIDGWRGDLARLICMESASDEMRETIDARAPGSARRPCPLPPAVERRIVQHNTFVGGTGRAEQPTLLMFSDSFSMPIVDLIGESFERTVMLHLRSEEGRLPFVPEMVVRERPDVVVVFSIDRYLTRAAPEETARIRGVPEPEPAAARFRSIGRIGPGGEASSFAVACAPVPAGKRMHVDVTFVGAQDAAVVVSWRPAGATEARTVGIDARAGWYRVRARLPPVGCDGEVRVHFAQPLAAGALESIEIAAEE